MRPGRSIDRLIEIMAALRTPVSGCPWDLEQDFSTIAPYTVEEAYEVADAIDRGDLDDLRDELGDLLLQIVFHARMAEEDSAFDFGDVVEAITGKLIRRHPHVFGPGAGEASAGHVRARWEEIKAAEKRERRRRRAHRDGGSGAAEPSLLDDVPTALPALARAEKLQKRAARVGFDWPGIEPVLDKVREELAEFAEAAAAESDDARVAEEVGDLLFAVANLARHAGIDAESALRNANRKFQDRFAAMEDSSRRKGTSLDELTLDEKEALWQAAKRSVAPSSARR